MKIIPVALVLCLIIHFSIADANALTDQKRIDLASLFATKVPLMLQFGKSWCPRCKSTKPILDNVSMTYPRNALIVPVDVEFNNDLVREFKIRLIPTQIFLMPDRSEFFRHEGILQEQQIGEILTKMGVQRSRSR